MKNRSMTVIPFEKSLNTFNHLNTSTIFFFIYTKFPAAAMQKLPAGVTNFPRSNVFAIAIL